MIIVQLVKLCYTLLNVYTYPMTVKQLMLLILFCKAFSDNVYIIIGLCITSNNKACRVYLVR